MNSNLAAYRDVLLASAREEATMEGSELTDTHFGSAVARLLEDAGIVENLVRLPFDGMIGPARARLSMGALDEDNESLVLLVAMLSEPGTRLGLPDVRESAERCLRIYTEAAKDGLARALSLPTDVRELGARIQEASQHISLVRVIVVTDAEIPAAVLQERLAEGTLIRFEIFDLQRLERVLGDGASREDIEIDLAAQGVDPLACLKVPSATGEYDTYLAALPGDLLSDIYGRYGTQLLELNVRAFLGVRGRKTANAGLRDTLMKTPDRFLAFNNGIVATADAISVQQSANGLVLTRLKGLQIVNGGQTTASLFRAKRRDRADISQQFANNSWSPDGRTRWFYERARGTYGVAAENAELSAITRRLFKVETPKERRFSKTDLAKYLAAWDGRPFEVVRGGQKNFQLFMQRLKQAPVTVDETWFHRLIALAILYRTTERIVRQIGFPAYRALISAYTVALLGQLTGGRMDFELIWKRQGLSSSFEALIDAWSRQVDHLIRESAGDKMPTEWAKKEECWGLLRTRLPVPPDELPPELLHQTLARPDDSLPGTQVTAEDYSLIQKTMELDAGELLKISEEGKQSGLLHWKVAAICQTVATYAAGGWSRRPSVKQCRVVMEAVEKIRAEAV